MVCCTASRLVPKYVVLVRFSRVRHMVEGTKHRSAANLRKHCQRSGPCHTRRRDEHSRSQEEALPAQWSLSWLLSLVSLTCLALQLHARRQPCHAARVLGRGCALLLAQRHVHGAYTEPDLGAGAADAKECRSGVRGGGAAASIVRSFPESAVRNECNTLERGWSDSRDRRPCTLPFG